MSKATSSRPGVSVVIPTFNRARWVRDAVESAVMQNYEPLEVIVIDDGSTDETPRVLAAYSQQSTGPVRIIRQANAGSSAARNVGIMAANYDLIAFLDSDNRWRPGKLGQQISLLTEGSYRFCFTAYTAFGPDIGAPQVVRIQEWHDDPISVLKSLLTGCLVNTSTVIAHRGILAEVGLFDTSAQPCEDHDLWLKIGARGHRFGYLDAPLTEYRVHPDSLSQESAKVASSTEHVIERFFRNDDLPVEIKSQQSVHLARWYLNSACRFLEAKQPDDAWSALWRAIRRRPTAIRPGWLRMLLRSVLISVTDRRTARRI